MLRNQINVFCLLAKIKTYTTCMKQLLIGSFIGFLCNISIVTSAGATDIKIGVLAKRGNEITLQRWSETANYLSNAIPAYQFIITPLGFEEIELAIKSKKIDFLLANSGMFVNLSFAHDLTAITTIKRHLLNNSYTHFGSVVFTRTDKKHIQSFSDLNGAKVSAVNLNSLGGWIAALREFKKERIDVTDFESLQFLGTHDAVVYSVLNNESDIGIVRTDTLERMENEGRIDLKQIRPLSGSSLDLDNLKFPFMLSSRLYPEWPLAKLSHISDDLAEEVAITLITMPTDAQAAIKAKIMGWTIPINYREVELAYSELKLGIFKELLGNYSIIDVLKRYWVYFLTSFFVITIMLFITIYIARLNGMLRSSQEKLRTLATHDALTGLPNRLLFYEIAKKYLNTAIREKKLAIVMFIDLDKFKPINDNFGHDAGDYLLKGIAKRLSTSLRSNDIVARIGGDEFLMMLWDVDSLIHAEEIMERVIKLVSVPVYDDKGNHLQVGCSLGASKVSEGDTLDNLIKKADLALYSAKSSGRGIYEFYDEKKHGS